MRKKLQGDVDLIKHSTSENNLSRAEKDVFKGASIVFVGVIVSKLLMSIIHLIVARKLGVVDYGLFSLSYSLIAIIGGVLTFGFPSSLARFVPLFEKNRDYLQLRETITFSLFSVFLISSLVAFSIVYISPYISTDLFKKPELASILSIFFIGLPFYCMTRVIIGTLRGFKAIKYKVYVENLFGPSFRFLLILVSLIIFGLTVMKVVYIYTTSYLFTFIISFLFLKKVFPIKFISPSPRMRLPSKHFLNFTWPLFLVTLISQFRTPLNIIVLGTCAKAVDVGLYNAAFVIIQTVLLIITSFAYISLPVFSELIAKDKWPELKELYKSTTNWILYVSFPLFLIIIAYPKDILIFLFGNSYVPASLSLQILAVFFIINICFALCGLVMVAAGKSKQHMVIDLLMLTSLGIVAMTLIPKFGIEGAAISFGVSVLLGHTLSFLYVRKFFRLSPINSAGIRFMLVSLGYIALSKFVIAWLAVKNEFIVLTIVTIIVFGLTHLTRYSIEGVSKQELTFFRAIQGKIRLYLS
ncbi:MAG: hypothetical protein DRI61_03810 [Chloroflexi bacterium]|nr:MAG: hypothetical protein DRI61_03810 [Chloroflexota bacterium]